MTFTITGSIFGLALVGMASVGLILPKKPEMWKTLPRERNIGAAIGVIALIWSAYLAAPLLEGPLAVYRKVLPVLVVVLSVMSFKYLEYIFTRALGGILLLSINYTMQRAFADHAPARYLVSIICYLVGIAAMFMIGSPWRFRDLLKRMTSEDTLRRSVSISLAVSGVICVAIAIGTHLCNG